MSKLLIRDKIIKTYAFKYIYILISIVTLKVTGCNHPSLFLFCVKSETAIMTDAQYSFSGLLVHLEVPGTSSELRRKRRERKVFSVLFNLLPSAARYAGTWVCWWFAEPRDVVCR